MGLKHNINISLFKPTILNIQQYHSLFAFFNKKDKFNEFLKKY